MEEVPRKSGGPEQVLVLGSHGPLRGAVLLEDGRPSEAYFETSERFEVAGNVYLGRVERVLPGMDCAFVELGLSRTGYLPIPRSDRAAAKPGEDDARQVLARLQQGDRVMVQVERNPLGSKGARLTTDIGLAGRLSVYFPFGRGMGVSHRISDPAERDRLREAAQAAAPAAGGLVVRTAAVGATSEEIGADARDLAERWSVIAAKAESAQAPALLHEEPQLGLRALRDLLSRRLREVVVDPSAAVAARAYVEREMAELLPKLREHQGELPLLHSFGIPEAIQKALESHVWLPSGGYLVVEETEAMTVVDVNTGRFTGKTDLRETAVRINLEAAREVARQLRLRNLGGLVVVDLIDMEAEEDRQRVYDTFVDELRRDRAKTKALPVSELGLLQMTRQRIRPALSDALLSQCGHCKGRGRLSSPLWLASRAVGEAQRLAAHGLRLLVIEAPADTTDAAHKHFASQIAELERQYGITVQLREREELPQPGFRITTS
jgi:ribonuclease G